MTDDEIMALAEKHGRWEHVADGALGPLKQMRVNPLAFARAIIEECAKVAADTICDVHLPTGIRIYGTKAAAAIRRRGE